MYSLEAAVGQFAERDIREEMGRKEVKLANT